MCALALRETGLAGRTPIPGIMSRVPGYGSGLRYGIGQPGHHAGVAEASGCANRAAYIMARPTSGPTGGVETLRLAGELRVPFTTGILIGIGETRAERLEALFAVRDLHRSFGHIQEVIVQNFRAKPGTKLAGAAEPDLNDLLWSLLPPRA